MFPDRWPQPALVGTSLAPGLYTDTPWYIVQGDGSSLVKIVDSDSASGAQSLLFTRGTNGSLALLGLTSEPPLAALLPAFVDMWLRPASFPINVEASPDSPAGTQVFVDGYWFRFVREENSAGPLKFYYHNQQSADYWQPANAIPALFPVQEVEGNTDVVAKDWVRCTVRVDPATQKADVWLNGRLAVTDVPRSADYAAFLTPPPFYVQGSTAGPTGFDDFQATLTNPLFGDRDADGMPDDWELAHGLNVSINDRNSDKDGDGLSNLRELIHHTLPENTDSDTDGMTDAWEVTHSFNPLFDRDAWQDSDLDGSSNLEEFLADTYPRDPVPSPPNDVKYVQDADPNGVPWIEYGTYEAPFTTLQQALDVVGEGGTIVVLNMTAFGLQGPGNTNVTINKSVTIRGNGMWLYGNDENWVPESPGFNITLAGNQGEPLHVTIEGFNFYLCQTLPQGVGQGGAVYAGGAAGYNMAVTLRDCWFYYCGASDHGGAVRFTSVASATIENCYFEGSTSVEMGGAVSAEDSAVTVNRCRFLWNGAGGDGGAIHFKNCTGLLENSLFDGNYTEADGGAVVFKNNTSVAVRAITAMSNYAAGQGTALYNSSSSAISLSGSILWGNHSMPSYSILPDTQAAGPWNARYTTVQQQSLSGPGNDTADPALSPYQGTLRPGSPAIDAGDPAVNLPKDLDGHPRQYFPGHTGSSPADRGCLEFNDTDGDGMDDDWETVNTLDYRNAADRDLDLDGDGFTNYEEYAAGTYASFFWWHPAGAVLFVNPVAGNDGNSGTSDLPVKSISRAIALCNNSTTTRICLRDGTYTGSLNKNLTTNPGGAAKKFYLKGINGKGRVTIDLQDSGRFITIENPAFDGTCGIECITIRRGKALYQSGVAQSDSGGAILVRNTASASQPFIARCSIVGCEADAGGGAVSVHDGSLLLFDTELFANQAASGGALRVAPLTGNHTVFIADCTFAYNYASDGGGGAISTSGRLHCKGGAMFNNVAAWGGALAASDLPETSPATYNSGMGAACRTAVNFPASPLSFHGTHVPTERPLLQKVRITANDAWASTNPEDPRGGAISISSSTPLLETLVVENNGAAGSTNNGGGLWCLVAYPRVFASVFRSNRSVANGGAFYADPYGEEQGYADFSNCAFCDNTAVGEGGAICVLPQEQGGGIRFELFHCTVAHNRSTSRVILLDGESSGYLKNCLVYYNRTLATPPTVAHVEVNSAETEFCDIEDPEFPVSPLSGPALAWDHYHILNPATLTFPYVTSSIDQRDIDGEVRPNTEANPATNTPANPPEHGCDEWTDSNNDGIPDWYAQIIVDLSATDAITTSTANFASLRMWGANGPTVEDIFLNGWNPVQPPWQSDPYGDADDDGLTNLAEYNGGTNPGHWDSDGDWASDGEEYGSTTDPNDAASVHPMFIGTQRCVYEFVYLQGESPDWEESSHALSGWAFDQRGRLLQWHDPLDWNEANPGLYPYENLHTLEQLSFPPLPPPNCFAGVQAGGGVYHHDEDGAELRSCRVWYRAQAPPDAPLTKVCLFIYTNQQGPPLDGPIETQYKLGVFTIPPGGHISNPVDVEPWFHLETSAPGGSWEETGVTMRELDGTIIDIDGHPHLLTPRRDSSGNALPPGFFETDIPLIDGGGFVSTSEIDMGVDNNRDEEITWDGSDQTEEGRAYRFWLNNDKDNHGGDTFNSATDHPWISDTLQDSFDDHIAYGQRDLEDLTRLHIVTEGIADKLSGGSLKAYLKWKRVISGVPKIRIFKAADPEGGAGYLKIEADALAQTSEAFKVELGVVEGAVTCELPASVWHVDGDKAAAYFLYEGVKEGLGELRIELKQNNESLGDFSAAFLKLTDVRRMTQRYLIDSDPSIDDPDAIPKPPVTVPAVTLNNLGFPYEAPPLEADEAARSFVFVHGWRKRGFKALSDGLTVYKRLWHQGFRGKFVIFRWPCKDADPDNEAADDEITGFMMAHLSRFNHSEFTAWHCGQRLRQLVNMTLPADHEITICSHSMGAIVACSAVENGMRPVERMIFLNAAIPAQCFDTNPVLRDLEVTDFADDAVPEIASQSYRGRFAQNMPDLVNFYQPEDLATNSSWEFNNAVFKPVKNSGTWLILGEIEREYKYLPGDRLIFDDLASVRTVISPYEAMPMINQSKSKALGSEERTAGSIVRKVDMSGPDYDFDTEHEAVFKYRGFRTWKFYERLLSEFQPPSQP